MLEWKSNELLKNHLSKHILEENAKEKIEQEIWKNNFDQIEKYLDMGNIKLLQDEYEKISKENVTSNNSHYLYKDTVSQKFSINYYNEYCNNYLTTCTKLDDRVLKIYSCFFKNICNTNLDVFLLVNNLCFKDINLKIMETKNFRYYQKNEDKINKYYSNAVKYINLQDPTKTEIELLTLFRLGILIEYLEDLNKKQKKLYDEGKTKIEILKLYEMLLKIFKYKFYSLNGENIVWKNFDNSEIKYIKLLQSDVEQIINEKTIYSEDKIFVDLLAEMVNILNYMNHYNKLITIKNSIWKDVFLSFR